MRTNINYYPRKDSISKNYKNNELRLNMMQQYLNILFKTVCVYSKQAIISDNSLTRIGP